MRPTSIPLSVHELQSFFSRPTSLEVVEVSLAAQASQAPCPGLTKNPANKNLMGVSQF